MRTTMMCIVFALADGDDDDGDREDDAVHVLPGQQLGSVGWLVGWMMTS